MREEGWKGKKRYWDGGRDKVHARQQYYKQMYYTFKILYRFILVFYINTFFYYKTGETWTFGQWPQNVFGQLWNY